MAAAYGLKTVVFTVDIQHAVDLAAASDEMLHSLPMRYGDRTRSAKNGFLPSSQDWARFAVLCNCAVLTEGFPGTIPVSGASSSGEAY